MSGIGFDEDISDADAPAFEPEPVEGGPKPSAANNGAGKGDATTLLVDLMAAKREAERLSEASSGSRVVEGVFDGMSVIGPEGRAYAVPANYASKSRLVEGDVMKLSIRPDGTVIFKQIGPVERRSAVGRVALDSSTGTHVVVCGQMTYKVLPASITFFKAEPGDEAVVLVPKSRDSVWAAG